MAPKTIVKAAVTRRSEEFGFAVLEHFMSGGPWTETLGIVDAEIRFGGVGVDCELIALLFPSISTERLWWQERFITAHYKVSPEMSAYADRVLSGTAEPFQLFLEANRSNAK